eukprot:c24546_g1_i1.p1 GENE.c24546_g1_i1~~c24546_g1_i1.p1  ORF type:complete len:207 (-),score=110.64 c24546_g1_i1:40-660(-)
MLSGPPAAGKGTLAEHIKSEYGVEHISTGDLLRAQAAAGTAIGLKAKEYMDHGMLVPDDILIPMVRNHLLNPSTMKKGWMLDGFPRTEAQVKALKEVGVIPDIFILVEASDEILKERVVGRRVDGISGKIYHLKYNPPPQGIPESQLIQRSDDTEEKLSQRLVGYKSNIGTIVPHYAKEIYHLNGERDSNAIWADVQTILKQKYKS